MLVKTTELIALVHKGLDSMSESDRSAAESVLSLVAYHLRKSIVDVPPEQHRFVRRLTQLK